MSRALIVLAGVVCFSASMAFANGTSKLSDEALQCVFLNGKWATRVQQKIMQNVVNEYVAQNKDPIKSVKEIEAEAARRSLVYTKIDKTVHSACQMMIEI